MRKFVFFKKLKQFWNFVWYGDGILSWTLAIILTFLILKFIAYPAMGFAMNTDYPIVSIVSGSMQHRISDAESVVPVLCGYQFEKSRNINFDEFWDICGEWYENIGISYDEFRTFHFRNGMNKGDIIFLRNPGADKIDVGDVIVFIQPQNPFVKPIIHRVVDKREYNEELIFQTKGDSNSDSINVSSSHEYLNEYEVREYEIVGRAIFRIPYLGYIKIFAYELLMKIRGLIL